MPLSDLKIWEQLQASIEAHLGCKYSRSAFFLNVLAEPQKALQAQYGLSPPAPHRNAFVGRYQGSETPSQAAQRPAPPPAFAPTAPFPGRVDDDASRLAALGRADLEALPPQTRAEIAQAAAKAQADEAAEAEVARELALAHARRAQGAAERQAKGVDAFGQPLVKVE